MQTAASFVSSIQLNLLTAMQPQPAQNMYVQSTVSNSSSQVRTNQLSGLYRGASTNSSSRNGTRHVPMQAIYPQTMHQSVVMQPFPQYQRQTFQGPPYAQYAQTMQPNYPYPYPSYYPVPGQRGSVGVNSAGVNNTIPNGSQPTSQPQLPIAPSAVLSTSSVASGSNSSVLGVTPGPSGQQVGVQSMVSVVQATVSAQPSQKLTRRRTHALEIIDPNTNKNILDDFDRNKTSMISDNDYLEQNMYMQQPMIISEQLRNMPYDMLDIQVGRDLTLSQTPVVSAIADGPSVEILPPIQKTCRSKKILPIVNPLDKNAVQNAATHLKDSLIVKTAQQQPTIIFEESVQHHRKSHRVPQLIENHQLIPENSINDEHIDSNISQGSTNTEDNKNSEQLLSPQLPSASSETTELAHINQTQQRENNKGADILNMIDIANNTKDKNFADQKHKEKNLPSNEYGASNEISEEKCRIELPMNAGNSIHSCDLKVSTIISSEVKNTVKASINEDVEKQLQTTDPLTKNLLNSTGEKMEQQFYNKEELKDHLLASTDDIYSNKDYIIGEVNCDIINPSKFAINSVNELDDHTSTTPKLRLIAQSNYMDEKCVNCHDEINNSENKADSSLLNCNDKTHSSVNRADSSQRSINASTITDSEYNVTSGGIEHSMPTQSLISYKEGQWSPNNPTGKKQYNKEQLLQLRDAKASRRQPDVNNVSIIPTPNLMPSFVRNPKRVQSMVGSLNSNRSATGNISIPDGGGCYGNKQVSMSGVHGRGSTKGMIRVNLSLNQDVKLNENDNAWRPRVLDKAGEIEIDPEAKTKREKEELIRRVRGILNKLTPEKFDALVEEIIKLKIDTPDKMEDVMVLVFEKAIDEPNFSVSYARLCHRLITEVKARDERMESGTKTNLAQFRAALIDKTEREFTENVTKSKTKEKKLQPVLDKISMCNNLAEKAELEAQLEEEERKIRRRSGGTVRFIGELFKISMLTGKIINSCIDALLNPNSEDQLECLCKLLTTVGAKFEQTPINVKQSSRCYSLDKTITRMQAIAAKTDKEGTKVSSRVRFMLQDVIDLRREKWQSKRCEAPKTMGQVEKEMKTEQLFNYAGSGLGSGCGISNGSSISGIGGKREERGNRYNDLRPGYGGSNSQRSDSGGVRRQQGNSGHANGSGGHVNTNNDDNTWHVQTSKGSRCLDTNKLEGLSNANNFDTKKMGGVSQFIWSTGSRQSSAPILTPTNSFAVLSALNENNRSNDKDRNTPRNKGSFNKGSTEHDRYGMHSRSGSQSSRENSSIKGPQSSRPTVGTPAMQKSTSNSKYLQQQISLSNRTPLKMSSSTKELPYPLRSNETYSSPILQPTNGGSKGSLEPPSAVFEKSGEGDIRIIKSVVSDMLELASDFKTLQNSIEPYIKRLRESQRCALLYYLMTDYLHLRHIGKLQRRYLGNVVVCLISNNFITRAHFLSAYKEFCQIAIDLALDIPDLWKYIIEFTGPLVSKRLITVYDLWDNHLKEDNGPNFGKKFLKIYLDYCLSEIGPSFTRTMWKMADMKWSDFMTEDEIRGFIKDNNYEYIEDESIPPKIFVNEPKEEVINKVSENVEHLLKEKATADCIIDYINGNFVEIDKQFIRNLATKLCDSTISYKENSYKLQTEDFQKICIPVLHRYIDSKEEYELECLYSMQLLVARLEHPRGLLSDLFGELYDADVIPQDSFIKWRDSKDQSAGKGVAVKGLNPFFNHVLSSETSDENN